MHTEEELYGMQVPDLINIIIEQDKKLTELMDLYFLTMKGDIYSSLAEFRSMDEFHPDLADYLSDYLSDEEKKDFTRNTKLARVPME